MALTTHSGSPPPGAADRGAWSALAAALGLGLLVRLMRIGVREAWLDEACTALFAGSSDLGTLIESLRLDSNPPLYYILMYGWTTLFGTGEAALRFPSLIGGLALIVLLFMGVRELNGGRLAAGLAAGLGALSPLLVYYSVEARAYTLLWTLATGVWLLLTRVTAPPEPEQRRSGCGLWAGALLLHTMALYTHHFALLLLPLWPLALLATRGRRRYAGLAALALLLLAYAPWAVLFLEAQANIIGIDWLIRHWEGIGAALLGSGRVMSLMPPFPVYLGELGLVTLGLAATVAVGFLFAAPVAVGLIRVIRGGPRAESIWRRALLPAALLLPPLGLAVLSSWRPIYLIGRYELLAYPAWIMLWALGVESVAKRLRALEVLGRRRLGATFEAALVALTLCGVALPLTPYLLSVSGPWPHRAAAEHLVAVDETAQEAREEVAVVALGLVRAPLEYQLRRLSPPRTWLALRSFPPDVADHKGWFEPKRYTPEELARSATELVADLESKDQIWLALPLAPNGTPAHVEIIMPLVDALLSAGHRQRETISLGRLGLALFRPLDS